MTAFVRPHGWGVCIPPQFVREHGTWVAEQELALLQPACWMNWHYAPLTADAAGFTPMIYTAGVKNQRDALAALPHHTWLLWNEPDRADQANMTPIKAYQATLSFLRAAWSLGIDYEFQWAAPGVWIDAQEGLNWATEYVRLLRRHGISRPSYWHVHSYRSPTLGHIRRGWQEWQDWYAVWGSHAPVVLSEVCAEAMPLDEQRRIMDETREMLARNEVVGVYWFSSHPSNDWPSHLCAVDTEAQTVALTPLGEHWMSLA